MTQPEEADSLAACPETGPQSALERKFIQEFLSHRDLSLDTLSSLPEEEAKALMREACMYASLKLAEIESRAHVRDTLHQPG